MIVVYVAGKFRGPTAWDVAQNVRAAEVAGMEVARLGAMPLIPHANTAHFDGTMTAEFWLAGTAELLRRSDALYVFHPEHARESEGTRAEVALAEELHIPAFFGLLGLENLREWVRMKGPRR